MALSWRYLGLTEKSWMQPAGEAGYFYVQQFERTLSWGSKRGQVRKPALQSPHKQTKSREVSDSASSGCWMWTVLSFVYHLFLGEKTVAESHQDWGSSHGGQGSQLGTQQKDSTTPQGTVEIGYIRLWSGTGCDFNRSFD